MLKLHVGEVNVILAVSSCGQNGQETEIEFHSSLKFIEYSKIGGFYGWVITANPVSFKSPAFSLL